MSKRITSPSSRWPGAVTLADPLTLHQALAWEKAVRAAQPPEEGTTLTEVNIAILPGVCACVETWELEGLGDLTPANFPGSPRRASSELLNWLIGEITRVYAGEEEKIDPNE